MELISHLGIFPEGKITAAELLRIIRGLSVLTILTLLAVVHQFFSACCHFAAILIPSKVAAARRFAAQMFWAVAIFFMQVNGVKITFSGDRIDSESAILMANHQSLADHFVLAYLAQTASTTSIPRVNFFTWFSLWSIPSLRMYLNMFSCDENWELSRPMVKSLFLRVVSSESPEWIIVFPEVNMWTPATAYLQRLQGIKFFLPLFNHLLYPRFSALYNAVTMAKTMGQDKYQKLYDVTIYYTAHKAPTLTRLFSSPTPLQIDVHITKLSTRTIPSRKAKLEGWLEKKWIEKDRKLKQMSGEK